MREEARARPEGALRSLRLLPVLLLVVPQRPVHWHTSLSPRYSDDHTVTTPGVACVYCKLAAQDFAGAPGPKQR
eukprot:1907496-Rhodomonas_salina.1